MKYKKTIAFVATLILSYFLAYPIGHWYDKRYSAGGAWLTIGPFNGYLTGLLVSYVFLVMVVMALVSRRIKPGFFLSLPVVLFALSDIRTNWAFLALISFALGLGLAWVILFIRAKTLTENKTK